MFYFCLQTLHLCKLWKVNLLDFNLLTGERELIKSNPQEFLWGSIETAHLKHLQISTTGKYSISVSLLLCIFVKYSKVSWEILLKGKHIILLKNMDMRKNDDINRKPSKNSLRNWTRRTETLTIANYFLPGNCGFSSFMFLWTEVMPFTSTVSAIW